MPSHTVAPPMTRALTLATALVALTSAPLPGCADETFERPASGTVELTKNKGVDFTTGLLTSPGNYANSDLFATENGSSGLKLTTGGDNPTHNRPITWHRNAGNVPRTFASLAEVPPELPTGVDFLPNAKTGHGFTLQTADGDYIRGWVSSADETRATVLWDRLITNK